MTSYKYVIRKRCVQKIISFYRNVSKKYKHTYSLEMMEKNVNDAYDSIFQIEQALLRRKPTIDRWNGYYMANTDKSGDMNLSPVTPVYWHPKNVGMKIARLL